MERCSGHDDDRDKYYPLALTGVGIFFCKGLDSFSKPIYTAGMTMYPHCTDRMNLSLSLSLSLY